MARGFVEAIVADSDVSMYPILRESHVVRRMLVAERPSAAAAVMTAAEGAEGAAADVAVGGLLERRRRLHGLPLQLPAADLLPRSPASLRRSAVEGDGESRG